MVSGTTGQSFELCNFGIVFKGRNIVGRSNTTTIRNTNGMIVKAYVDLAPLSNIYFATFDKLTVNYVTMHMTATYIDQSMHINDSTMPLVARLISNNKTIWTGELPLQKPLIEYYPDFIVLMAIVKIASVDPRNLWYHYSQNGSFYHKEKVEWAVGSNTFKINPPKVISHFYFSTPTPCTAICNVTTDWVELTYYMKFVKDVSNTLLRKISYALDQDLDTCFNLPLPQDSPSLFWLRITQLSFFGVASKNFIISITGENIECARVGQKSLQVGTSGPTNDVSCDMDSEIAFCSLVSNTTTGMRTQCDIECRCNTLSECSDVHILMQSVSGNKWSMCDLTINDVP
ncbi:uncharacterized protein [Argopecten irradians]|uniref:uncharacterized protein n=1 Tax=Argopecten irradians TaxID=31199 RepID=UPI0037119D12